MSETSQEEIEASAAFFRALHELLEEQKGSAADRRRATRRSYECIQLLALYDGRNLPAQADFCGVLCHDLSPGGFSFYAAEAPRQPYVIIALGAVPFTFFVARVLRVTPAGAEEDDLGQLVGCRFIRRVVTSADLLNLDEPCRRWS
jgi:hypothetical protein